MKTANLKSDTSRADLPISKKPYFHNIGRGIYLGYRRNQGPGTWLVRAPNGTGRYWEERFATDATMDFDAAVDKAREMARREENDGVAPVDASRPLTVGEALDQHKTKLESNGDKGNATRVLHNLKGHPMLTRAVMNLIENELTAWKNSLKRAPYGPRKEGLADSTINRTIKMLRKALEEAARRDKRIKNLAAIIEGLKPLDDADVADNVILDDATVHNFVAGCYTKDEGLGVLADVLAETGARTSQATRLLVKDFIDGPAPRLTMPKSGKGKTKNRAKRRAERYSVAISLELAATLRKRIAGRSRTAPLLTQTNGKAWPKNPCGNYRMTVRDVVTAIGRDPDEVTMYALRHSSIVRALIGGDPGDANNPENNPVPIRIVAALHDTSVLMIEKHYSAHIVDHTDAISRAALRKRPTAVQPALALAA